METKTSNNKIGYLGECIAANFLEKQGYQVIDRNYRQKWGEIDLVARGTTKKLHFIEVKTVSYETKSFLSDAVLRRTWRPEENVHQAKLRKLSRTIETWLSDHKYDVDWQIDVVAVRVVPREKYATVKLISNVIL